MEKGVSTSHIQQCEKADFRKNGKATALDSTPIQSALCSPPCYFGTTENIREPWWKVRDKHNRRWYHENAFMNGKIKMSGFVAYVSADDGHECSSACFEEANTVPIPLSIADRWSKNFPFNCENRTNRKHLASYTICWIVSMHQKHDSFHPCTIAVKWIVQCKI